MKKHCFLLITFAILLFINGYSTNYTSSQNGNWMNPLTWTPIGIPLPGDDVIINHTVTLDTSLAYTSGSITINASANLNQDSYGRDIWLNGTNASFTNNGTFRIRSILLSDGSFDNNNIIYSASVANFITLNNNDLIVISDSLYNDGIINNYDGIVVSTFYNDNQINNYGHIEGFDWLIAVPIDSMYNNGTFLNDIGAYLWADSCTNANIFTNNGIINFDQFTNWNGTFTNANYMSFSDMTNTGTFTNQDSLIGTGSVTNTGNLNNQAGAYFNIAISYLNANSINNNATFTADGRLEIGDSFYNFDIINGTAPGSIQCADTSYNSGTMNGTFDFCDATPPATSPFIDINLGTIDPLITYCSATSINENEFVEFNVYPNPTTGIVHVGIQKRYIEVYNAGGKKIIDEYTNQINLKRLYSGIYYLMINDDKGNRVYSNKIIKE